MDGILLLEHVGPSMCICADRSLIFVRLSIALELAKHNPTYEDIASKFFEVRTILPIPMQSL